MDRIQKDKIQKIALIGLGSGIVSFALYKLYSSFNSGPSFLRPLNKRIEKLLKNNSSVINLKVKSERFTEQDGIKYNLQIIDNLASKPTNITQMPKDPFSPPFEQDLLVHEITNTHNLLLNKYSFAYKSLIVATKAFEKQGDPINQSDFSACVQVTKCINGFFFFQSGENAGSSVPHKHFQVQPNEELKKGQLIDFINKKAKDQQENDHFTYEKFDFNHVLVKLAKFKNYNFDEYGAYLEETYKKAMRFVFKNNNLFGKNDKTDIGGEVAYNLLVTDQVMLIALRIKKRAFDKIPCNALVFLGIFAFKNEEDSQNFDPSGAYHDICYNADSLDHNQQVFHKRKQSAEVELFQKVKEKEKISECKDEHQGKQKSLANELVKKVDEIKVIQEHKEVHKQRKSAVEGEVLQKVQEKQEVKDKSVHTQKKKSVEFGVLQEVQKRQSIQEGKQIHVEKKKSVEEEVKKKVQEREQIQKGKEFHQEKKKSVEQEVLKKVQEREEISNKKEEHQQRKKSVEAQLVEKVKENEQINQHKEVVKERKKSVEAELIDKANKKKK